jgi:hypothetical protein
MALPGEDEVLAFELPPIRGAGHAVLPDQFSIRLRIRLL